MEEYVESAIEKGITEICFADHMPFPGNFGFDESHRMEAEEMETYLQQIDRCRSKYREISILTGIEADYYEGYEEYLEDFLSQYPFDLVIMSIHFIKKWGNKGWVFSFEYTEETLEEQYRDYFDALLKGVETGLFDVVGHFDLVKRIRNPVMNTNARDVVRALDAVKQMGMCLELNASGLRKHVNETYPAPEIVALAVEKEIPFILSSDAHKPDQVGYEFDELFNQLFNYPGLELARFRKREATVSPLIPTDSD
jgi:histidinol-phosphatase (PHP family)